MRGGSESSGFSAQSTHNIGVCMALGADTRTVLGMILRNAMRMALLGIIIGAAVALAVTRLMRDLLFGVTAGDPVTFVAVALLLTAVTMLASYIPARRATRINPVAALRYD
jgi:putative ABC transport system permease protein